MITWFEVRHWILRRLSAIEAQWHWPRNVPKRFGLFGLVLSLIFVYFLLNRSLRPNKIVSTKHCIGELLERKGIVRPWGEEAAADEDEWQSEKLAFTGNGFIGLEAVSDQKLVIFGNESGRSNLQTSFYPLASIEIPLGIEQSIVFTDNAAIARHVRCSVLNEKCVCMMSSVYAHRTRPNLLVQDVQLVNPSSSSFTISFKRKASADYKEAESAHHSSPIYSKSFGEGQKRVSVAVMCSSIPKMAISIKPKVEENFRFLCYLDKGGGGREEEEKLIGRVSAKFAAIHALNSDIVDREHGAAWESLNSANFHISHSKAPNSLNQADIDRVRTLLLSSVNAPLLLAGAAKNRDELVIGAADSAYCFTGISTMLTPSKLWQKAADSRAMLRIIDIWRATLEHRGCANLIRKYGAHGLAQAFLLSLSAGSFSNGAKRLEFGLNPETELHRNIKVHGLSIGNGALASLDFQLDLSLKPFVTIRNENPTRPLFACTAGCQELPHSVGNAPISLAIKMTRPTTSILLLSEHKSELELLRQTLHVIEVFDAPAHEQEKIDLHKHGNKGGGGLPTMFWVVLVFLLIAFHLFLFKLLYSEWKNSSTMVPYSKFNKKVLFRR